MADYIALAVILTASLYLFWQPKLRTDVTALLVTLAVSLVCAAGTAVAGSRAGGDDGGLNVRQ
jgi:hypothetical protein